MAHRTQTPFLLTAIAAITIFAVRPAQSFNACESAFASTRIELGPTAQSDTEASRLARMGAFARKGLTATKYFTINTVRTGTMNWWTAPSEVHPNTQPAFIVDASLYHDPTDIWLTRALKRSAQSVLTRLYRFTQLSKVPIAQRVYYLKHGDPSIAVSFLNGTKNLIDRLFWSLSDRLHSRNHLERRYVSSKFLSHIVVPMVVGTTALIYVVEPWSNQQRTEMIEEALQVISTDYRPFIEDRLQNDVRFTELYEIYQAIQLAPDAHPDKIRDTHQLLAQAHLEYLGLLKFVEERPHTKAIRTVKDLESVLSQHPAFTDLLIALKDRTQSEGGSLDLAVWRNALTHLWLFHAQLAVFEQELQKLEANNSSNTRPWVLSRILGSLQSEAEDIQMIRMKIQTDPAAQALLNRVQSRSLTRSQALNLYSRLAEVRMMRGLSESVDLYDVVIDQATVTAFEAEILK